MTTTRRPPPPRLAPMPGRVLSAGLCTQSRRPEMWTSSLPAEREKAVAICAWCPALDVCRAWSASLPTSDNSIVAGLDSKGRQQLRRAVQEPVPVSADAEQITSAA